VGVWYQAIRPRSLTATYIPIALGGVLAWQAGSFDPAALLLALMGTLALQIAANLFNEYYDHQKGVEAGKSHGLGMILKNGHLTPQQVLMAALANVLVAVLIGLYFVATTGWVILAIGLAAVLVVFFYTATRFALAYNALGEIAVFIFMGPLIVFGAYYVMVEKLDPLPFEASLPIAFLVAAILHANNLRDLEADREGGKTTLATLLGRQGARWEYALLTFGAPLTAIVFILTGDYPPSTALAFLSLPVMWDLNQKAFRYEDMPTLHTVLVGTARLHAMFGALYVFGWFLGEWL
jgi:1,4-dihydroxy-2-naphthoate polyprenyltransferase